MGLMSRPRVLLLMPTSTYRAADFVDAGIRMGVEVVVASDQRQTLEEAVPASLLSLDFRRPDESCRRIVEFAGKHPLRAVVGVEDETTVLASLTGRALGLPHNPPEAARATRDKHLARQLLRRHGIPVPDFLKIPIQADPQGGAAPIAFPCVLKPLFLSASRGVIRADNPVEFGAAFRRLRRILELPEVSAKGGESANWILVESYVPGIEVALEGLLTGGRLKVLALFDKPDPLDGPFFEETLYVTPSRLPASTQEKIARCAERTAEALGLREGPIHAEMRMNESGVWPLEVAARSIGGLCSRTLRFGAGLSLEELILRHALGMDVKGMERERRPAGVMMIPIPASGILRGIRGLEAARSTPGVEEVIPTIPVGQEVVPLPEGSRYLGFIFARAETSEQVEEALRKSHRCLQFEIAPRG